MVHIFNAVKNNGYVIYIIYYCIKKITTASVFISHKTSLVIDMESHSPLHVNLVGFNYQLYKPQ